MASHSSSLGWKIPWMEEPGRLQSTGSLRVGHGWATSLSLFTVMHWRRKWQPTPVLLPGESQRWGSLVGCVYGVAQSRTRLKRLSISIRCTAKWNIYVCVCVCVCVCVYIHTHISSFNFFRFFSHKAITQYLVDFPVVYMHMSITIYQESRLPRELSRTSDMKMTPTLGRKKKRSKELLDEIERGEWKSWPKTQHSGT